MDIDEEGLYIHIGSKVQARRQDLGFSQKWVADRVGVTRASVANIESGLQRAPLHLLYRICLALQLEVDSILPSLDEITRYEIEEVDIDGQLIGLPSKTAQYIRKLLTDSPEE